MRTMSSKKGFPAHCFSMFFVGSITKHQFLKPLTLEMKFVREMVGFHGQVGHFNNLSGRRWGFTDKITFCEITINRNSRGAHKKMRCVTKNGTTQNWIESNNLHIVI